MQFKIKILKLDKVVNEYEDEILLDSFTLSNKDFITKDVDYLNKEGYLSLWDDL